MCTQPRLRILTLVVEAVKPHFGGKGGGKETNMTKLSRISPLPTIHPLPYSASDDPWRAQAAPLDLIVSPSP